MNNGPSSKAYLVNRSDFGIVSGMDNETNTVIKISCFVGLCIEIWKINKVRTISFQLLFL